MPPIAQHNLRPRHRLRALAIAIAIIFPVAGNVSATPFDISQLPLGSVGGAAPNIMYIYDDSSSMGYGFLPEDILNFEGYRAFYSSDWNKQYYNPNVLYLPPKDYNGLDMDQPGAKPKQLVTTFTSALIDPFLKPNPDVDTNKVNLSSNYQPLFYSNPKGTVDGKQMSTAPYSALRIAGDTSVYGTDKKAFYYVNTGKCSMASVTAAPANSCFTKVTVSATSGTGPAGKDERQNFANWYTFYRVHGLAASTSMSRAFSELGGDFRVGYASLVEENRTIDGVTKDTNVISGVRPFRNFPANDPNYPNKNFREEFYDWIFHLAMTTGTPLRRALNGVGKYYERSDAKGPYVEFPGVGGKALSCRKNITILMTDGYGNDYDTLKLGMGNVDGSVASTIKGTNGQEYTYLAPHPFQDTMSDTLADVAMYYWNRDLRKESGMPNDVPANAKDPAFWQHMQTYTVGLGVEPKKLDKDQVFAAIDTGTKVAWPAIGTPSKNDGKIEDLMHAAVNGRGDFFAAQDTEQFADAMRSMIASIKADAGSVSRLARSSATLNTSTLLYEVRYDSTDWHGNVFAYGICTSGEVDKVEGCTATGVPKTAPTWEASAQIGAYAGRNILSWNPDTTYGIPFQWNSLSLSQRDSLVRNPPNTSTPQLSEGNKIVDYVRGDTSKETGANAYRKRKGHRLGDIFSDPVFSGPVPNWGYENAANMMLAEQTAYMDWKSSDAYKETPNMLYVGANDGMLHAFDATTGKEKAAYVPASVIPKLWHLADKDYGHEFYADTTPVVQEALINGVWKNVLIGTAGAGGNSYYALDVTNPDAINEGKVLWEFKHPELGFNGTGQATIARLTNIGEWVVIFGNGYNSQSHRAQLFVVKLSDGNLVAKIDTGVGDINNPNGLSTPKVHDHEMDAAADVVYAGDMRGNLWRFNLNGMSASLLLKATGPTGEEQPITARPLTVRRHDTMPGTMVYVGTGKFFETSDATDTRVQSFYGVLDTGTGSITRDNLVEQSIISTGTADIAGNAERPVAQTTDNPVNYTGGQKGFVIDLPEKTQRILSAAQFIPTSKNNGTIMVASRVLQGDSCSTTTLGWQMELDPLTGAPKKGAVFGNNNVVMIGTGSLPVHVGGKEGTDRFGGTGGTGSSCIGDRCGGGPPPISGGGSGGENEVECGGEYYFTIAEHVKGLNNCLTSTGIRGRVSWREIITN